MTPPPRHPTVEGAVLNTYPVCDATLLPAASHPHSSRGIQSSICVQLIETETQICKSVILMSQIADSMQTRRPAQHKQLRRTTCFGNP